MLNIILLAVVLFAQAPAPVPVPVAIPVPVVIEKPTDWPTLIGLFCTAVIALAGAYNSYQARKKAEEAVTKTEAAGADILRVEKATNSMHSALVAAASSEGKLQGQVDERARADALVEAAPPARAPAISATTSKGDVIVGNIEGVVTAPGEKLVPDPRPTKLPGPDRSMPPRP